MYQQTQPWLKAGCFEAMGHDLRVLLHVAQANRQDREQVAELAQTVQEVTGDKVDVAVVDQGYTGESAQIQAQDYGIDVVVVKHTGAKRELVLLPQH